MGVSTAWWRDPDQNLVFSLLLVVRLAWPVAALSILCIRMLGHGLLSRFASPPKEGKRLINSAVGCRDRMVVFAAAVKESITHRWWCCVHFHSSCFSRFFFLPSRPRRSGVKSCISTTQDSVPAHHRLVGAAEPLSGWLTPASDERLECDSAPPFQKLQKTPGLLLLMKKDGDVIPALCMCSVVCTCLAALLAVAASGTC